MEGREQVPSHYMFGLFRSEPEASKHAGISYLLVDMASPGIRVAPMKQIDGGMDFNEVFFDDVRVPAENLEVGDVIVFSVPSQATPIVHRIIRITTV